ncbi:DUF1344 domain-containing protein [Taklimakanibacter deserti]|uniref:DUF1344 domain-containing protein n=1 Tax=Taklimakanibacter deserti TaxID=2267839 RepID=UPI000E64DB18
MRKLIFSTLLILPLLAGAALAASSSGTVSAVNTRTGTLQLSNGATYYVPNRVMLSRYRQGDVVRIQYERREGLRVADDVVKTGSSEGATIVTPTRDVGVNKNFMNQKSDMCEPTPSNRNPCYDIGGQ